jgi:cell wall-associated NlpC family hydrolase
VVLRSGHMGIATGNDTMIHAPHPGTVVQEAAIFGTRSAWWGWRPVESFNFPAPEGG